MKKTHKLLIISLTISLSTISVILYYTFSKGLFAEIDKIDTSFFIIAVLAHISSWLVWGLRVSLLSNLTTLKIKFKRSFEIVLSSMFAAALTPSYAGGEPVRIYLLGREEGGTPGCASAVVFGERTLDFLFLMFATALGLFLIGDIFLAEGSFVSLEAIVIFVISLMVLVIALLLISLYKPEKIKGFFRYFEKPIKKIKPVLIKKIYEEIDNFNESLWMFLRGEKKYLILGFLITAVFWTLEFSIPYLLLRGLGYDVQYILAFAGYALVMISIMIPISPGGTGVAETVFYFVYNSIVKGFVGIGVLVLLWRFITYYLNLAVGGIVSSKMLHDISTIEKEI
ncbi:hypothetical protein C9439_06700 [archaeon SCG-AAA382B04]|nr:hypothetical protein C9439_06700 [archaeon SCG-AAA382B04]